MATRQRATRLWRRSLRADAEVFRFWANRTSSRHPPMTESDVVDGARSQQRGAIGSLRSNHIGSLPHANFDDRLGYRQERVPGSRDRRGRKGRCPETAPTAPSAGVLQALPPCLIGMEACATAHYWARELTKLGHRLRLMPAKDVKAYVKRNKNDAAAAEPICEAVRRSTSASCGSNRPSSRVS